jgi:hypothetical protein
MRIQIVMDHTGDTRYRFDATDAAAVAEAEERFQKLTSAGFTAAERTGPGQPERCAMNASGRRRPGDRPRHRVIFAQG